MADKSLPSFFTEEHLQNLPSIRIKKAILENFKSVRHGEIVFQCGRTFVPYGTQSDILGIYGQNGSGKTSFIEALSILQRVITGAPVPSIYADCIAIDQPCALLEFVFDLQYKDGTIREATYSFCMGRYELSPEEIQEKYKDLPPETIPDKDTSVTIYNEKFSLLWEDASKRQLIIDTSPEEEAFVPKTKRKELAGNGQKILVALAVNKQLALRQSRSFLFVPDTLQIFFDKDPETVPFRVLLELTYYGLYYLRVIDTKSSGYIRLNAAIPIYMNAGRYLFDVKKPQIIPQEDLTQLKKALSNLGLCLEQLVPGLSIGFRELSETMDKEGNPARVVMLTAYREGQELPLRDESDGVRKIISILSLIVDAFNEESVTVAIDEFDAGIFEYLLGEILQALEESGKGQFIFTSHNLRPLEVINKKFLYFTTTNPDNRYIRLKNISATNNLRDTYFREIILNEQEEEVYKKTKRHKIISALKKAGGVS